MASSPWMDSWYSSDNSVQLRGSKEALNKSQQRESRHSGENGSLFQRLKWMLASASMTIEG